MLRSLRNAHYFYARSERAGYLDRIVAATVGYDYYRMARCGIIYPESSEQTPDHQAFVVRGNHNGGHDGAVLMSGRRAMIISRKSNFLTVWLR
jgi:hypothetical protein